MMIIHYIQQGGLMMWPLLACSVLLGAVLIERLWTIGVLHCLLKRQLRPHRIAVTSSVLAFFKDIPPGIGLLGTVIGVVRSFGLGDGPLTAESAAVGLGVACFTTIAGLAIALIASVCEYVLTWAAMDVAQNRSRSRAHV